MAKVLLVQPRFNYVRDFVEVPSKALLTLGTLAQNSGHEVLILHLDIDHIDIRTACKLFKPDIVGLSVNTLQVKSGRLIALQVRQISKDIKIVIGGPHAGFWDGEADEVVTGAGENRWLEILGEKPSLHGINDTPELDYSLVELDKFCGFHPGEVTPAAAIIASIGCPNNCTFCNTPVFWGKKVRYRSPELVVKEIERLVNDYHVREITFQDDTFNINHKWASEIFYRIIEKRLNDKVIFRMTSRVDEKLVTKEFLDLARRAGVWFIFYGVESGSQLMLDRMKKGITVEEIKRAVKMTKEAGIYAYCSFIVGLPGETKETLKETGKLIAEIRPSGYDWAFACPFPGTEFFDEVKANGHLLEVDFAEYSYGMILARTDELSFEDIKLFKGFEKNGGDIMEKWSDFYAPVCGSRKALEGNIMEHSPLITEIAKYLSPGDKVLEIGSGTGVMASPLVLAGVKVVSIDNDPEIIKMAQINAAVLGAEIEFREADAFHLVFDDRTFKVAFSEGLIEHYSDDNIGRLVAEHQRMADVVVISVPLKGSKNVAFGDERWLTMEEWEALLKPMGACKGFIYGLEPNACFTFIRNKKSEVKQ